MSAAADVATHRSYARSGFAVYPDDMPVEDARACFRYWRAIFAAAADRSGYVPAGGFAALVRDELAKLEVVVEVRGRRGEAVELVSDRTPTPAEWARAALAACCHFCERYTVRNAIDPDGDARREAFDREAGRA